MRKYFNPEMMIASFETEAVEATVTASQALNNWAAQEGDDATRYTATVDFSTMQAVDVQF